MSEAARNGLYPGLCSPETLGPPPVRGNSANAESQTRLSRLCIVGRCSPERMFFIRRRSHENPIRNPVNFRRKQQNAILVGPLPQLVPIFLDLGVHGVGRRSVSDGIGEYNDIAVCKKPQRNFAWSGKNAVNAMTEPRIDVQIPMEDFNAKQFGRAGILVVNDTI
jgi:hypothetical protein